MAGAKLASLASAHEMGSNQCTPEPKRTTPKSTWGLPCSFFLPATHSKHALAGGRTFQRSSNSCCDSALHDDQCGQETHMITTTKGFGIATSHANTPTSRHTIFTKSKSQRVSNQEMCRLTLLCVLSFLAVCTPSLAAITCTNETTTTVRPGARVAWLDGPLEQLLVHCETPCRSFTHAPRPTHTSHAPSHTTRSTFGK